MKKKFDKNMFGELFSLEVITGICACCSKFSQKIDVGMQPLTWINYSNWIGRLELTLTESDGKWSIFL